MSGGFEDLGLLPELVRATQDQHWILPSDVQDESIPLILGGGDVMVVSAQCLLLAAAACCCCRMPHFPAPARRAALTGATQTIQNTVG